jgi:RHS repeat-associated protein
MGLFDNSGSAVVEYTYDAWGNILNTTGSLANTVGVENTYRYRGYRFVTESGLYYLQCRYYNPVWGRFINSDTEVSNTSDLLGSNTFIYVKNNPVNMTDPTGQWSLWATLGVVALVAAVVVVCVFAPEIIPAVVAVATENAAAIGTAVTATAVVAEEAPAIEDAVNEVVPAVEEALPEVEAALDDCAQVVRGGLSTAENLQENLANSISAGENPAGISCRAANGLSIDELASSPTPFRNGQITTTTVGQIRAIGMDVISSPSLNNLRAYP